MELKSTSAFGNGVTRPALRRNHECELGDVSMKQAEFDIADAYGRACAICFLCGIVALIQGCMPHPAVAVPMKAQGMESGVAAIVHRHAPAILDQIRDRTESNWFADQEATSVAIWPLTEGSAYDEELLDRLIAVNRSYDRHFLNELNRKLQQGLVNHAPDWIRIKTRDDIRQLLGEVRKFDDFREIDNPVEVLLNNQRIDILIVGKLTQRASTLMFTYNAHLLATGDIIASVSYGVRLPGHKRRTTEVEALVCSSRYQFDCDVCESKAFDSGCDFEMSELNLILRAECDVGVHDVEGFDAEKGISMQKGSVAMICDRDFWGTYHCKAKGKCTYFVREY